MVINFLVGKSVEDLGGEGFLVGIFQEFSYGSLMCDEEREVLDDGGNGSGDYGVLDGLK